MCLKRFVALLLVSLLVAAGCARRERPKPLRPLRERVAEIVPKKQPTGTVSATAGHLTWEDEQGRPLLEAQVASVEGAVSAASGTEGPVTLHQASCRLFENGKPTTWLKAPLVVWDAGRLVASRGATAGSLDGRLSARAKAATWTAEKRILDLTAPVCSARQPARPALVAEGPTAQWSGGVLSLPQGVKARTSDGITTMQARQMRWRAATGRLQATGGVEVRRTDVRLTARQLAGDTQVRRVRCTGSPRLEITNVKGLKRRSGAASGALLAMSLALAPAAAAPPQQQQERTIPAQHIVLRGDEFEGDQVNLNGEFRGDASLTSPRLTLTSARITLKGEKGGNRLARASALGSVRMLTKTEQGSVVTATGATATYDPGADRATLTGGVKVQFTSPQLAGPGTLVGDRAELTVSTGKVVVYRAAAAPVAVTLRPKASDGPVDLRADRVEADVRGGVITATGNPIMKYPQGTLAGDKIWFEIDRAANDVRVAHAEGNVRLHAAWQDGRTADGRAQRATYLRAENRVVLEAGFQITERAPDVEGPRILSGETANYDLKTRVVRVQRGPSGQVEFQAPVPERAGAAPPGATPATPRPGKGRPHANPNR